MKRFNLIVVFNKDLTKALFCIRAKEPYKGLYNFVGGKVEENEPNDEAAYRELFEETGISSNDIELDHFMDLNYFKYENNLQVYYFTQIKFLIFSYLLSPIPLTFFISSISLNLPFEFLYSTILPAKLAPIPGKV